ncbi:MAG TPA: hypothetical protein VMZ00_03440 [Sporichthya sp.]|nr:hypothetical protein [Sporichthya sp.]
MSWEQDRRWASGAAVALIAALAGVPAHLALRADSEGTSGPPVLLLGGLVFALALWPLAARATSVRTLTAVLAVAQFGTHALAVAATGEAGADPRALVCCPSSAQVRPGLLGSVTAHAGWGLVAVQLLACLLLALAVRGGRAGADLTTAAADLVRAILSTAVSRLLALAWLLRGGAPRPTGRPRPVRPTPARVLLRGRLLARRSTRRGPPARRASSPVLSRAAVAPLALPAAG